MQEWDVNGVVIMRYVLIELHLLPIEIISRDTILKVEYIFVFMLVYVELTNLEHHETIRIIFSCKNIYDIYYKSTVFNMIVLDYYGYFFLVELKI